MKALARLEPLAYDLLRFIAGALLSVHGLQKLFGVLTDHRPPVGSQLWVGGLIELVCGTCVALGLFTRVCAFVASGMLAVAYFQFHFRFQWSGWQWLPIVNRGELAVIDCFVFLYVATRGGGRFGVDARLLHRR